MIFTLIACRRNRRPRHVRLALPTYLSKGYIMTKVLNLPNDAQALITVDATDGIGAPIALPSGGTATSSNPALFTASVNVAGQVLVVAVPGEIGTATLTYDNGTLSDTATVNVTAPVVAAVSLDVADAVISSQTATASAA